MDVKNNNIKNEFFLSQWIEGNLSDAELKKKVSEEDFLAYKELKKGIDIYSKLAQPLEPSFEKIQQKIKAQSNKTKVKKLNIKWIASIAATLLFFVGFYALLGRDSVLSKSDFGEQKNIALLDGSEVILNAKSAINYSKKTWKKKRDVYLNGEAFFKVKKGSKFTVKTKNGNITVLGTQFNVKSVDDYFEVVCYEGKVQVTNDKKTYILLPTESIRKIKENQIEKLSYKTKKPTWLFGESTYRSVPLKYVIDGLEKQYNIQIDSKKIDENVIYTGSFTHKNIEMALKTVFETMRIKYKKTASNIIVLDK